MGVSFNGPFHTENSPYVSFKTFYSIIYTFKIIICNRPSCHIRPVPPLESGRLVNVVCWKKQWPQDEPGAGSNSNQQPFRIPFTFPMLSGSGGSQQEAKGVRTFTFGRGFDMARVGCPSVGLVRARQTCHRFVSAHGT